MCSLLSLSASSSVFLCYLLVCFWFLFILVFFLSCTCAAIGCIFVLACVSSMLYFQSGWFLDTQVFVNKAQLLLSIPCVLHWGPHIIFALNCNSFCYWGSHLATLYISGYWYESLKKYIFNTSYLDNHNGYNFCSIKYGTYRYDRWSFKHRTQGGTAGSVSQRHQA